MLPIFRASLRCLLEARSKLLNLELLLIIPRLFQLVSSNLYRSISQAKHFIPYTGFFTFGLAAFVLWMIFPQSWLWGLLLYLGSFVGDAVDGWAARKWDQCSTFGSVLDMVTDRCATLGLLQILTAEFSHIPDSSLLNQVCPLVLVLLATLDISSHWCQMYASLLTKSHHKSAEANQDANPLVQLYYANYYFFGYLCVGAELTYILALVFVKTLPSSAVPMLTWVIILPACVMKQLVNVAQLLSACRAIAQHDADLYNQKHRGTTSSNSKKD